MLFVLVAMFGCADASDRPMIGSLPIVSEGEWVANKTGTDTLEFLRFDDGSSLMILNRGKEFRDGYHLPKIVSGPYAFVLKGNKISL